MLLASNNKDGAFANKVFLIDCGSRRWLRDASILTSIGLNWPDDVAEASDREIAKHPYGAPTPIVVNFPRKLPNDRTMQYMREYVVSQLSGSGVEFGAAANPLPIPLGCSIVYADLFETPQLEEELYDSSAFEYVPTNIQTSFDKMDGVMDESMDFIIASHVIEHVRDPIGAIELAHTKLRSGGKLVLIVPKRERTLDRDRELTTLEHVIEDNTNPCHYRDALHVIDFHAHTNDIGTKEAYKAALESISNDHHSMHYHVWNEKGFTQLLKYINKSKKRWNILVNEDACRGEDSYEFYVVLEKI